MKCSGLNIVIPVRSLRHGKSRLAPVLSKSEWHELNRRFFVNTLDVAISVVGIKAVVVVSRCPEVSQICQSLGIKYLFEITRGGLNPALSRASRIVGAWGVRKILVLPSDLPMVERNDLCLLVSRAGRAGAAIAPDRWLRGTNALCVPTRSTFNFQFGFESYAKHRIEAGRCEIKLVSLPRCSLSFDVDWPRDLLQLSSFQLSHEGWWDR